jgi:hypothetical protein
VPIGRVCPLPPCHRGAAGGAHLQRSVRISLSSTSVPSPAAPCITSPIRTPAAPPPACARAGPSPRRPPPPPPEPPLAAGRGSGSVRAIASSSDAAPSECMPPPPPRSPGPASRPPPPAARPAGWPGRPAPWGREALRRATWWRTTAMAHWTVWVKERGCTAGSRVLRCQEKMADFVWGSTAGAGDRKSSCCAYYMVGCLRLGEVGATGAIRA